MNESFVIANGERMAATLPSSLAEWLRTQGFVPGTVVVEHNGEAVAPSEFGTRSVAPGDRLEIVRLVAGG
jgi:sulfur carrier protein